MNETALPLDEQGWWHRCFGAIDHTFLNLGVVQRCRECGTGIFAYDSINHVTTSREAIAYDLTVHVCWHLAIARHMNLNVDNKVQLDAIRHGRPRPPDDDADRWEAIRAHAEDLRDRSVQLLTDITIELDRFAT